MTTKTPTERVPSSAEEVFPDASELADATIDDRGLPSTVRAGAGMQAWTEGAEWKRHEIGEVDLAARGLLMKAV